MSTRFKGCAVCFDADLREEDAQPIVDAIRLLHGVAGVTLCVKDVTDDMARIRVRRELQDAMTEAFNRTLLGS